MDPVQMEAYLREKLRLLEQERSFILVLLDEVEEFHTTTPLTPVTAAKIKRLREDHPDWHQHQIASYLNVNQGRVSEVLSGKKFPEIQPFHKHPERK